MGKKRHFKGNNASEDRKRRRDHAEKWKQTRGDDPSNNRNGSGSWGNLTTENKRFEAFYKAQHFTSATEEDWTQFLATLRESLPACFRISPDYAFAEDLNNQLMSFMGEKLVVDDIQIEPVEPLHWYPHGYGYKLGTDRRSIRKLPALSNLHKWMVQHTDNGNITRQEAVSMVPPIALDVQPHHRCLDMCAAPGSKTSQFLEIINRSLNNPEDQQGLVVANDADTDRAYMLVHQCKRINSPLLTVTTHKGQLFPTIKENEEQYKSEFFDRVLCDVPCSGDGTMRKNPAIWGKWNTSMGVTLHPLQLMIARRGLQLLKTGGLMVYSTCSMSPYENESVVAELLRSHEGTLELVDARQFLPLFKARPGLNSWYVLDDHYALKREQRERKAARSNYNNQKKSVPVSSNDDAEHKEGDAEEPAEDKPEEEQANPVEVQEPVGETEEKKDFSHIEDPELRACLEMDFLQFKDFSEVPQNLDSKFRRSLFPPSEEEKQWMHLERCLRCVPQDEDTGGFFVATFRKIAKSTARTASSAAPVSEEAPEMSAEELASAEQAADAAADAEAGEGAAETCPAGDDEEEDVKQEKATKASQRGLVEFFPWDVAAFEKVKQFYKFDDSLSADNFFIREDIVVKSKQPPSTTGSKSIYYIPKSVRTLLEGDKNKQMKIVMSGVKVFEKKVLQNGEADYRMIQVNFVSAVYGKTMLSVILIYIGGNSILDELYWCAQSKSYHSRFLQYPWWWISQLFHSICSNNTAIMYNVLWCCHLLISLRFC